MNFIYLVVIGKQHVNFIEISDFDFNLYLNILIIIYVYLHEGTHIYVWVPKSHPEILLPNLELEI